MYVCVAWGGGGGDELQEKRKETLGQGKIQHVKKEPLSGPTQHKHSRKCSTVCLGV